MLAQLISDYFSSYWGPLRLLSSITVLSILGAFVASFLSLFLLPRLWHLATRDKGRNHAHDAEASIGKPLGVGIYMNIFFVALVPILVPWNPQFYLCALAILIASAIGLADDAKLGGLSELTLGLSDLALAILACAAILYGQTVRIWLPFTSLELEIPFWAGMLIFTPTIWLSVNALNCNDGVDGLSGTLSVITLIALGFIIYLVVGHIENSRYLLIPHKPEAAIWMIGTGIISGTIIGYLWHNAPPSAALMGDAGSRPVGLFIGMLITVIGNPIMILFVAPMILVNGATGLVKVGLIRVFRIHILKSIRFPLHDHMRKNLNWSNPQVLIRFMLIHLGTLSLLMLMLLKLR
jgi:phospho-N-acetylmuramoyl-pentapeptide-transferase